MSAIEQKGFEEESEWRLVSQYPDESLYGVSFRPGRFGVTPYFELPIDIDGKPRKIDEVIIGPTPNKTTARNSLELLLSKYDAEAERIGVSHAPLRR